MPLACSRVEGLSYSPKCADSYRRSASHVDKILKGAKPADLPVEQPTRFKLVTVERVSGGDTVILRFPDGRRERTRLIGIDTPKTHAGAKLDRDTQRTGQGFSGHGRRRRR